MWHDLLITAGIVLFMGWVIFIAGWINGAQYQRKINERKDHV